jgi:hypothetical protein
VRGPGASRGYSARPRFMRPAASGYHQLMNGTSEISRPGKRRRHKRDSPWLPVMARLWKRGWGARRIAAALSDLSAKGCRDWLAGGADPDSLDDFSEPGASHLPWTARQVRHWMMYRGRRRREGQPRRRPRPPHPDERGCDPRRRYASERGWLFALPAWEEGEGWVGGVELSRRDVDVLCCLRDHGPMTRGQIADALQLHGGRRRLLRRSGESVLGRLRRAGIVEVAGRAGGRWNNRAIYALAGEAGQPPDAANERL